MENVQTTTAPAETKKRGRKPNAQKTVTPDDLQFAIARQEPAAPAPTPASLIQTAIMQNLDIDKLAKLMELQERYDANAARREFFDALAEFQSTVPVISKNKTADFELKTGGRTKYKYATLDQIVSQIQQPLQNTGLTYRWEFTEGDGQITAVCIITHRAGHRETTTMTAAADTTGSKNAIQAKGSTRSYLQRYTLIGALGIATADDDNDGALSRDDMDEIIDQLALLNTVDELVKYYEQPGLKKHHGNAAFQKAFTARKNQITK